MRIAICDDNTNDLKLLKKIVENYMEDHEIKVIVDGFTNSRGLLEKVNDYKIIILDIVMGNKLGIDIAKQIHNINSTIPIVFYSSNMEYAPDTYESHGSGFLVKPLDKKKVYKCLDRIIKKISDMTIQFKEVGNNLSFNVYVNDIEYIKSKGKYTFVKVKNKEFKCRKLLKEWMLDLDSKQFLLCKRGLLVNAHSVIKVDAFNYLLLNCGEKIKLSEEIGEEFKAEVAQFWADNI